MYERWSLVWKQCSPGCELGRRFGVERYGGYLPFFVDGEDLENLQAQQGVQLNEPMLLKGILCGLCELDGDSPMADFQKDTTTLYYLLNYLGTGFGQHSPEEMILNVAARIRERNGPIPAATVLREGTRLVRQSSRIRCDLILTLWEMLEMADPRNHTRDQGVLQEIPRLFGAMDVQDVLEAAREMVVYITVAALAVLGRQAEAGRLMETDGSSYLRSPQLRARVEALLLAEEPRLEGCF